MIQYDLKYILQIVYISHQPSEAHSTAPLWCVHLQEGATLQLPKEINNGIKSQHWLVDSHQETLMAWT